MVRGSLWMVCMRWAVRGIGLVSTLVLARLLAPEDFGLVAMTAAGMQILLVVFQETGFRLALIRLATPSRAHYDTAFWLGFAVAALVALAMIAAAPLIAGYFEQPLVAELLRIAALVPLLQGLESIRTVDLQKHLLFAADFRFNVMSKVASFAVTIALALWLGDYRALVWGMVAGAGARTLVSYLVAPHLPRPSVAHAAELVGFSAWFLVSQLGEHATDLADRLIAGRLFGAETLGFYHVASDLAVAPARELTVSVGRALQPVYARLLDDPAELGRKYLATLGVIAAVSLPPAIGLALVARDAVVLLLGTKWLASAPLIAWLAPAFALHYLTRTNYTVLHLLGRARRAALLRWPLVAGIVVAMAVGGSLYGIAGVAAGRLAALLLFAPWPFLVAGRLTGLRLRDFAGALWRPASACAAMALAVTLLHQEQLPLAVRLAADVAVGAVAYTAASLLLWRLAGRPEGIERYALARLGRSRGAVSA